jgi:thiamine kinase-like enzyme
VAKELAKIHNLGLNNTHGLLELDVPPFEMWYDYFLENNNVKERLGSDIIQRVRSLIKDNKQSLTQIDKYHSLIHSDFRPANMIIDSNNIVYIVDWEYSCKGHILADIGQFFRYSEMFSSEDIANFEVHYNKIADVKLPKDFYNLCKIRDLVNPLQLLSSDLDKPVMYKDLANVIIGTLDYFSV